MKIYLFQDLSFSVKIFISIIPSIKNLSLFIIVLNIWAWEISWKNSLVAYTRSLHGPGPGTRPITESANNWWFFQRARQKINIFSKWPGPQKRNEFPNGQAGLQKKGRCVILRVRAGRHNKDEILKPAPMDKRIIMYLA